MKKMAELIENISSLSDGLLFKLGATAGQLAEYYDHLVYQDDARDYEDYNSNRKAMKLARHYRNEVAYEAKRRGPQFILKYKNYRPAPFLTHFDGIDFILIDYEKDAA